MDQAVIKYSEPSRVCADARQQERVDDEVVGLRIQRYLGTSNPASWDEFLTRANIREFNALEKATRYDVSACMGTIINPW